MQSIVPRTHRTPDGREGPVLPRVAEVAARPEDGHPDETGGALRRGEQRSVLRMAELERLRSDLAAEKQRSRDLVQALAAAQPPELQHQHLEQLAHRTAEQLHRVPPPPDDDLAALGIFGLGWAGRPRRMRDLGARMNVQVHDRPSITLAIRSPRLRERQKGPAARALASPVTVPASPLKSRLPTLLSLRACVLRSRAALAVTDGLTG